MAATTITTPPRHLDYLDSARGIAALMVVLGHYLSYRYIDLPAIKGLNFLVNAADAVSFFFVLSGMVLTYQYVALGKSLDLRKYYLNRVFRLFPAFFIAVLVNALYIQRHAPALTTFYGFLTDKNEFWEEAMLIKSHVNFFAPGWTLTLELAISFFIPFLIIIGKADRRLFWWLLPTSLILYRVTDLFIFHFTLGCVITFYFQEITSPAMREKRWYKFRHLILLVGIVLFSVRRIEAFVAFPDRLNYWASYLQLSLFHYSAIGSFIFLILLLRSPKIQWFLSQRMFVFIGKISYGIYLMHWLIVHCIYDNWDEIVPHFPNLKTAFSVMLLVCVACTLVLATMLHYWVELPFIRIGKRIAGRLKPSVVIE